MRYLVAFTAMLCLIMCISSATAGPITDSIAFQGHLTDAVGNSVPDGPKDIILSIWTDSTGGTMLHSETVTVTTSKGLFSTCLGCGSATLTDVIESGDLWLQTQISGQAPMAPRTRMRSVPRAIYANGVYGEATSGSAKAKGIISVKASVGSGATSNIQLENDNNSDGTPDVSCSEVVSDKFAQVRGFKVDIDNRRSSFENNCDSGVSTISCSRDNDGDGVDDNHGELTASSAGAALTLQDGKDGEDQGIVAMTGNKPMPRTQVVKKIWATGHNDGVITSAYDSPDGVVGEMAIEQGGLRRVTIDGSAVESSMGLHAVVDATGTADYTVRVRRANDDSVDDHAFVDSDGDGVPEYSDRRTVSANEFHHNSVARSGGTPVSSIAHDIDSSGTSFSMSTKLTGAPGSNGSSDYTVRMRHANDDSVDNNMSVDTDGDGVPECSDRRTVSANAVHHNTVSRSGSTTATIRQVATPDSAAAVLEHDSDGDGTSEVTMESKVSADSATFRLNGLPPGIPVTETISMTATPASVHMEVGAATCDGTNWTNASDKNAKENFEQINGAELLEQIEELPITKWNYKQDDESVKHIGPTAQDFKSAFGVGVNDKTISTIDPSGIALAAIKELYKQNRDFANQNRELLKQNANLQKQIDELAKKIEKLAAGK